MKLEVINRTWGNVFEILEGHGFLGGSCDNSGDYPSFGCYLLSLVAIEFFCWSVPLHSLA